MPQYQVTATHSKSQDPFRWQQAEILNALDNFRDGDPLSQRQFAEQLGIPAATFNYWHRHHCPDPDDPVDSFFRSGSGHSVLRHIIAAAVLVFVERGACGIRLLGDFLQLSQLDRFVASSRGALQPLTAHLESDLLAFAAEQQPLLAAEMKPRTITLVPDEHFHAGPPCLIAIEPVSNFIAVECYSDHRDADTWTQAIKEGIAGMPACVIQITSDQARGLLCCAEKGLQAVHSPDLFHGQRDLLKPLLFPLGRPIQQAEKDLQKAQHKTDQLDTPMEQSQSFEEFEALVEAVKTELAVQTRLEEARQLKEEAVNQVRAVGDDYHPFDRQTGQAVTAEEVGERLNRHLDGLQEVVRKAALGEKAKGAISQARKWVQVLMGCVGWFWSLVNARLEELDLSEEQQQQVKQKLLPGYYWEQAAARGRTGEERKRLKEMAERLKEEAFKPEGALSKLAEEERSQVEEMAREIAGLFCRSSSCVEGRNGRLSLQQHGHSRVPQRRLKALTVIHNYMVKRPDGTTAAQRFFGHSHKDVFSWLLERMPDLPRPAPKRRKPPPQPAPLTDSSD